MNKIVAGALVGAGVQLSVMAAGSVIAFCALPIFVLAMSSEILAKVEGENPEAQKQFDYYNASKAKVSASSVSFVFDRSFDNAISGIRGTIVNNSDFPIDDVKFHCRVVLSTYKNPDGSVQTRTASHSSQRFIGRVEAHTSRVLDLKLDRGTNNKSHDLIGSPDCSPMFDLAFSQNYY